MGAVLHCDKRCLGGEGCQGDQPLRACALFGAPIAQCHWLEGAEAELGVVGWPR